MQSCIREKESDLKKEPKAQGTEDREYKHTHNAREKLTSRQAKFSIPLADPANHNSPLSKTGVKGEDFLSLAFKLSPQIPGTGSDTAHKSHDLVGTGAVQCWTVGSAPTFFFKVTACVYLY